MEKREQRPKRKRIVRCKPKAELVYSLKEKQTIKPTGKHEYKLS